MKSNIIEKEKCSCHEHKHEHHEGCGCNEHKHEHHEGCGCHEHKHEHHEGCGCGHSHDSLCGCGHDHSGGGSIRSYIIRIAISVALAVAGGLVMHLLPAFSAVGVVIIALGFLVAGYDIILSAFKSLFGLRLLDENFLMTVAAIGAFILGEYFEALAVLVLFRIGNVFEAYAEERSRKSVLALKSLTPDEVTVLREGSEITVDTESVECGEEVVLSVGERASFDAVIVDGRTTLDTAAITGESMPREAGVGDEIYSGSINLSSRIVIRVTKRSSESTVSRILRMVESASERKSHHESFIRRFAKVYTPAVVVAALLLAVVPLFFGASASESVYRALSFLVVSCPCALVISVPLAAFCGIGRASRNGILIKGGRSLELLEKANVFCFDKTGTLTEGRFSVESIECSGNENEFLSILASAESSSTHPVAVSVVNEAKARGVYVPRAESISEIAGKGTKALINGSVYLAGSAGFMEENNVTVPHEVSIGSRVYLASDGNLIGSAVLSDKIKEGSAKTLESLKKDGAKSCIILTGDVRSSAVSVGEQIGVDEVLAELLPSEKLDMLEHLKECGNTVVFTGDGINDAPVLAAADVGVSIGDFGSDAAIEASDIVLLSAGGSDIEKLYYAYKLSKRVMRTIRTNVIGSITIKILVLLLCSIGAVGMWAAILADVGVLILAILNSMRI